MRTSRIKSGHGPTSEADAPACSPADSATDQNGLGDTVDLACPITGISYHYHAEEELKPSDTFYRRLFEASKDAVLILHNPTGTIVDASRSVEELLGYRPGELVGKRVWEIDAFKEIITSPDVFSDLQHRDHFRYEHLPVEKKDGSSVKVQFNWHKGRQAIPRELSASSALCSS